MLTIRKTGQILQLMAIVFLISGCRDIVGEFVRGIELNPTATQTTARKVNNGYYQWQTESPQLLVRYGQKISEMIWNDPSVIRDGYVYRMWMGAGKIEWQGKGVNVYSAVSTDGVTWDIDPRALIPVGKPGDFDEKGIETPSVIKVDGTYHMYYTGSNFKDSHEGRFSIGHATSKDGSNWVKDPKNPVIPRTFNGLGPGEGKPNAWGWLSVAEPGAVYDPKTKKIFVYFVGSKLRFDDYSGAEPKTQMGILVATSTDGSNFEVRKDPAMVQTASYPHSQGYYGYSTPSAMIDSEGKFHLFYDAAKYINPGQSFLQVALAHAVSDDGFSFTERDIDIVVSGRGGWMNAEVRAPAAVEGDNHELMLYFAGGWKEGGVGLLKGAKLSAE